MVGLRKSKKRNSRPGHIRLVPILPNLITTLGLALGLASVVASISVLDSADVSRQWVFRRFWWAAALIGMAVVVDMLDGRMARVLKSESRFGASYDSLSDLVSFGVAPAVLLYAWGLSEYGKIGFMSMLFYVVCAALRLARFNVQFATKEKRMFTGLPSPMAAGLVFSPILLMSEFQMAPADIARFFYLFFVPVVGLVMVSEVPCRKFPEFARIGPFSTLVTGAIVVTALVTNPGIVAVAISYGYFLMELGVCAWRLGRKAVAGRKKAKNLESDNL